MALADVVIATNETFRQRALTQGGKAPEDVFVVRNAPDPSVFRPVAPDARIRSLAPHIIGYVGLMGRQDGVDVAIQALALLAQRRRLARAVRRRRGRARRRAQAGGRSGNPRPRELLKAMSPIEPVSSSSLLLATSVCHPNPETH